MPYVIINIYYYILRPLNGHFLLNLHLKIKKFYLYFTDMWLWVVPASYSYIIFTQTDLTGYACYTSTEREIWTKDKNINYLNFSFDINKNNKKKN